MESIIIGGAPMAAEYAQQVNANGYTPDASQAAPLVKGFTEKE
jgi:methanogenic corrinoid protein MtbC1